MAQNIVLAEAEFEKFRQFCRARGFDLCYYSPEISGSEKEIESYPFDSPKVIKLRKRRFGFQGTPYDVAAWQGEKWASSLWQLWDKFRKGEKGQGG